VHTLLKSAIGALSITLAGLPGAAHAQAYPSKLITVVVPAPPGGLLDILARALAQRFTSAWGQQVIVEYKPGANFQIGAALVAKSAPDGHTLLVSPEVAFTINPSLYAKLQYDAAKDFAPISVLAFANEALIASPALPVNSIQELIALARAKPGALNYGSFGRGSTAHLHMALLGRIADIDLTAIHYKGSTPALTDLVGGHVQLMFADFRAALPQAYEGKVRVLAVESIARLPQLPDVPTLAEAGYADINARTWFGLFAPAATPQDIVVKINAVVQQAFADAEFRQRVLAANMLEPVDLALDAFARFIVAERAKWGSVIEDQRITLD